MLSIGVMAQGQGAYYIGLAREDYYMDGGEPPGIWHGKGAEALGLSGLVEGEQLTRLFEGFHPTQDNALVELQEDKGHRPGWDLTFSAPKSVSVLWSQADQTTRQQIQEAQFTAVKAALDYLEDTCEVMRWGKGGSHHSKGKLIFATFEHGTSRAMDPQLHTHALLMNVGQREDGGFRTLDGKDAFQSKMVAGALYRAELAYQLELNLGVEIKRRDIYFEVEGVPNKLCETFSKRRAEIEAVLSELGYDSAEASSVAALSTRSVKGHAPRAELFALWGEVGQENGWSQAQALEVVGRSLPQRDLEHQSSQALEEASQKITEQHSTFSERDFVRRFAEAAPGRGIGAREVVAQATAALNGSPEFVPLGRERRQDVFTTREMLEIERGIFARADASRDAPSCGVRETVISGILASKSAFSEEQANALRHITQENGGSIRLVSGMAGTGKTTLLHAARMSWEVEGYKVRGACLSGKATEGLRSGAGIESSTIHRTLWELQTGQLRLDRNTVLVVDEAGMVGTRQMEKLVESIQSSGATLVLVSDVKQLQSIEAGGVVAELERRLGSATLTEIRRQREEWARDAVHDFAKGRANKGLAAYAKRGLLHIEESPDKAREALIAQWKVGGIHTPEDQRIFTGTRQDAAILNRMAQDERRKAGVLSQEFLQVEASRFHVGDRVLFTAKSRRIGVLNGSTGEVVAIEADRGILAVRLDHGERVQFSVTDYDKVRLGYAMTTHKGQGETVERAYILAGGGMQDREISYVQASRSRGETHIFSDSFTAGKKAVLLVRQMSESRAKETAHAVANRLGRYAERDRQHQSMDL